MASPIFRCPSQKLQGYLGIMSFSHTYIQLHLSYKMLSDRNHLSPSPTTTAWGQANHPSDCYTVFLNDLFLPFTTLTAILLKSKCAVELTSPKERSGLCLGYSEVMCHVRQKCPCSGQGVWVTQYRQTWNLKFTSMDHQSRPCNEAPIQILWTPKLEWVPWLATPCALSHLSTGSVTHHDCTEENQKLYNGTLPDSLPYPFDLYPFFAINQNC